MIDSSLGQAFFLRFDLSLFDIASKPVVRRIGYQQIKMTGNARAHSPVGGNVDRSVSLKYFFLSS
jgi:hypothetical protein